MAAQAWLNWQCKMISGVIVGGVYTVKDGALDALNAGYPERSLAQTDLERIASLAVGSSNAVINSRQAAQSVPDQLGDEIALRIKTDARELVVAIRLTCRSQSQHMAVVQLLQWAGVWLGSLQQLLPKTDPDDAGSGDNLLQAMLARGNTLGACLELSNLLAQKFECERVSVGLRRRLAVRLQAISQVADFDQRRQLVRSIEAVMEEALDQHTTVQFSTRQKAAEHATLAHLSHTQEHGDLALCTVPFNHEQESWAVCLERTAERPFSDEEKQQCEQLLERVAPLLSVLRQHDRSPLTVAVDAGRSSVSRLLKPGTRFGRWASAGTALLLMLLMLVPVNHRVVASASIEGADRQLMVAPQDGFVASAYARAGDIVEAGQLLAELDKSDLKIERDKWLGELEKTETSQALALTARDRTESGLLLARKTQIEAELALVNNRLQRAEIRAPFNGVLISGDLNQTLGAPVEIGQTLFEIASMEEFRLLLDVSEYDAAQVAEGQTGYLRLSSLPGQRYQTTVKSVLPVAIVRDRRSVFQLEASLDEDSEVLRPGMQGVARITVGKLPLGRIWFRSIAARVRIWFWKLGL